MKKQFRIIEESWANEYGDKEDTKFFIQHCNLLFGLPITNWKSIKSSHYPGRGDKLYFHSSDEAQIFIKTVLEKNKPRLQRVRSIISNEYEK